MTNRDHQMELALGLGLRIGVIVASLVTLAGGVWLLAAGESQQYSLRTFDANDGRAAFHALLHHGPRTPETLIALGILLLIATPVLRVAAMIVGFLAERDWMYAVISAIVLAVLTLSFFF